MPVLKKVKKVIKHPIGAFLLLLGTNRTGFVPDELYLKIMFRYYNGTSLNLKNPQTFNEKLQWIKLYDRKNEYTVMVDKVKVRDYVASKIGDKYLIPLLGVWDTPEEIVFDDLPNQFVLKCNHNSGTGMLICRDKGTINIQQVKEQLWKGIRENYWQFGREWPYKNVPRKILCEKYMVDESGDELKDYKVLCFNGEPKLIELHQHRFTSRQTQDIYDTNWNKTTISQTGISSFQVSDEVFPKPSTLTEMLTLSRVLADGIPHVRVDWYSINGKLYFGELTFFDGSGLDPWDDPKDDLMMGSWITLPNKTINS